MKDLYWPKDTTNLFLKDYRGGYTLIYSIAGKHTIKEVLSKIPQEDSRAIKEELGYDYLDFSEEFTTECPEIHLKEELDPDHMMWNGENYFDKDEDGKEIVQAPVYVLNLDPRPEIEMPGVVRV